MTILQFLERLKQTPRDWQLRAFNPNQPAKLIRRGYPWQCPISSLLGKNAAQFWDASIELGLLGHDANVIASAADASASHDSELREQLLEACGLAKGE